MPELPEVEVLRADLEAEFVGRRVEWAVASGARTVRRHPASRIGRRLAGARIGAAARIGKFLVLRLEDGTGNPAPTTSTTRTEFDGASRPSESDPDSDALVVHLGMSGQLRLAVSGDTTVKHTHAVVRFDDGRELRFVDPRTFGELFVGKEDALRARLGPDALAPAWGSKDLAGALAGRRAPVKAVLLDQRRVAGLGNIYTDEALFAAGVRFDRPAGSLTAMEVARLHRAVRSVLRRGVRHRGSSLSDGGYVDLYGRLGGYAAHHRVYGREGRPCTRCRTPLRRVSWGGRSSFFCPACQR